jgi:geranylgeranyl transferase type-2 subunit alpha
VNSLSDKRSQDYYITMHNRKKVTPTAEQVAASQKKAVTLKKLSTLALKHRNAGAKDAEAVKLNSELLALNPDISTLWNYRREVLLARLEQESAAESAEAKPVPLSALVTEELRVSAAGITRNPKSYPAWHHRQWIVARFPAQIDFVEEQGLCGKLLDADERNFHCWNYRRWCVALAATRAFSAESGSAGSGETTTAATASTLVTDAVKAGEAMCSLPSTSPFSVHSELAYTLARINKNFSNYSAWHYRSHLLLMIERKEKGGEKVPLHDSRHQPLPLEVAGKELELVRKALYCEPDDQSGWFYHRWVLDRIRDFALASSSGDASVSRLLVLLLLQDAGSLLELREAEPLSKWPCLGLAHVFQALQQAGAAVASSVEAALKGETGSESSSEPSQLDPGIVKKATDYLLSLASAEEEKDGKVLLVKAIQVSFDQAKELDPSHHEAYSRLSISGGVAGPSAAAAGGAGAGGEGGVTS